MPIARRPSENDTHRARMLAAADAAAGVAVERESPLRGEQALRVARHAVLAATPHIRCDYVLRVAGISQREQYTALGLTLGALVLDLAAFTAAFVRGGRTVRAIAGAAIASNISLVVRSQRRQRRLRAASAAELTKLRAGAATCGPA